ncbi:hypothetical protein D9M68_487300 [compost metagenome]
MSIEDFAFGVRLKSPVTPGALQWWSERFWTTGLRPFEICRRLVECVPHGYTSDLFALTAPKRYAEFEIFGNDQDGEVYALSRAFDLDESNLYQGFLEIRPDMRNLGYGKIFAQNCYRLAGELGLERLLVKPLDGGSYFWARAGFLPSTESWNDDNCKGRIATYLGGLGRVRASARLRVSAFLQSSEPATIWMIADMPDPVQSAQNPRHTITLGKALLAESGATWHGSIDFTPHALFDDQHDRVRRYIFGEAS